MEPCLNLPVPVTCATGARPDERKGENSKKNARSRPDTRRVPVYEIGFHMIFHAQKPPYANKTP